MPVTAALEVGGVKPQIRKAHVGELAASQLRHFFVKCRANTADLLRRHLVDTEGMRHLLDLAGRYPVGVHLGHGGHHRLVGAAVALEHVFWEIASHAQLRDAQVEGADRGHELPFAVPVAGVAAICAGFAGLHVHDLVQGGFDELSCQSEDIDASVVGAGCFVGYSCVHAVVLSLDSLV